MEDPGTSFEFKDGKLRRIRGGILDYDLPSLESALDVIDYAPYGTLGSDRLIGAVQIYERVDDPPRHMEGPGAERVV